MSMKKALISIMWLTVIITTPLVRAQIVNVAPSLNKMEKNGFAFEGEGALEWRTGNTPLFTVKGSMLGRYMLQRHNVYLLVSGRYGLNNGNLLEAAVTEHLRYQYDFTDWFGGDLFLQHQYSEFKRLAMRNLAGVGPHFSLPTGKSFLLSIGTAYMIEFEKYDYSLDEFGNKYSDAGQEGYNHRWTNFIGWSLELNQRVQLIHVTYFQPRFDALNDFRAISEFCIKVELVGKLSLKLTATAAYNSRPAQGVDKLDTFIGNSLSFSFAP